MYKQARLIDSRSYTMQTTGFDAFHRPLTIQYPNNEIVTLTYDREGEQTLQAGADLLVDNVTYNARGQMARLERANGLDTVLSYYGATGTAGTGNSNFLSLRPFIDGNPCHKNASPALSCQTAWVNPSALTADILPRFLYNSSHRRVEQLSWKHAKFKTERPFIT
jgi:hypothetical protein